MNIIYLKALDEALKSSYTNTVSWRLGIDMSSETDVLSSKGGDTICSYVASTLPESVHEAGVELRALHLVLEERSLPHQRLVLRVCLDGSLGVRQQVLELLQHLAGGGARGSRQRRRAACRVSRRVACGVWRVGGWRGSVRACERACARRVCV